MGTVASRLYFFLGGSSKSGKTEDNKEDSYHVFVQQVIAAVDKGDVETLSRLQEHSTIMSYSGVEAVVATPPLLHRATSRGHAHVLKFLLDQGADVNTTDASGMTVFHEVCKLRKPQPCFEVIGRVRDIDKRDVWGRTPLIKALIYRNVNVAMSLLKMGANPNAVDTYGITPLGTAVNYNLMDMVQALVLHGADINLMAKSAYGFCGPPLYLAINNQNPEMVDELIRLGANTQPRTRDYQSNLAWNANSRPWQYFNFNSTTIANTPMLQHTDAVSRAMAEVVKRDQETIDRGPTLEILMALLSAHGHALGPSSDVLLRVLLKIKPDDFTVLLHKFQVCSSSCQDDFLLHYSNLDRSQSARFQQRASYFLDDHFDNNNLPGEAGGNIRRLVTSLENQARRMVRKAMMKSGRNVVWATKRLQCPPALKSLILLRDIDRDHGMPVCKVVAEV